MYFPGHNNSVVCQRGALWCRVAEWFAVKCLEMQCLVVEYLALTRLPVLAVHQVLGVEGGGRAYVGGLLRGGPR